MNTFLPDDPRVTFALFKLQDILEAQKDNPDPDFTHIVAHRDEVISRYQHIFRVENLSNLSKADFISFLIFKNNHHWTQLSRVQKHMTEDMDLLRQALSLLLDESRPINERLNEIRPERIWAEHSMVSHLGMPVLTAILMIMYPDRYGVWNNTSDKGMKIVRLWQPRWETDPAGDCYQKINDIYLQLARCLGVDLWTLDALWWVIKK